MFRLHGVFPHEEKGDNGSCKSPAKAYKPLSDVPNLPECR